MLRTIAEFDRQIAAAYSAHPDHGIFASLPGAGPVLGPRLLASLGADRDRFASAASVQCYTGVAPVTKRSGGSCHIHRRYCCPKFQRQSFHEYAKESVLWSRWAGQRPAWRGQERAPPWRDEAPCTRFNRMGVPDAQHVGHADRRGVSVG